MTVGARAGGVVRRRAAAAAAGLLLAAPSAACGRGAPAPGADTAAPLARPAGLDFADTTFALRFAMDLARFDRRPSGLWVLDTRAGRGGARARPGNAVALRYGGYLANGTEFDASARNGKLLHFVVGQHRVIEGLEEGLKGMHVGGRRRLIIPPALAYGKAGFGGTIPSRATLVFDVELVELR